VNVNVVVRADYHAQALSYRSAIVVESRVVVPTVGGVGVLVVRSIVMRPMVCRIGTLVLGVAHLGTARGVPGSS
jgi:hypothetical protein